MNWKAWQHGRRLLALGLLGVLLATTHPWPIAAQMEEAQWWEPPTPRSRPIVPPALVFAYEIKSAGLVEPVELQLFDDGELRLWIGNAEDADSYHYADLHHLAGLADVADFFSLKERYGRSGAAGGVSHVVTLHQGGVSKIVTVGEQGGRGAAPPSLWSLIAALRRLTVEQLPEMAAPDEPIQLPGFPPANLPSQNMFITFEPHYMGGGGTVQIRSDGQVKVYFVSELHKVEQLAPGTLALLREQVEAANLFELEDRYYVPEPEGCICETPEYTLIATEGVSSKKIITRGIGGGPQELVDLQATLLDIHDSLFTSIRGNYNDLIVDYAVSSGNRSWSMQIDKQGGAFLNYTRAGQLSEGQVLELIELFKASGWGQLDWQYRAPPEIREKLGEERKASVDFIMDGIGKSVDAYSGADVPLGLNNILVRLAELYVKVEDQAEARVRSLIGVGMPKSGTPGQGALVLLLGVAMVSAGFVLRHLKMRH